MTKRFFSGVILACTLTLAYFWTADMRKDALNPNSVASTIYDSAYATKKKILDMATEANRQAIDSEYEQIVADIEEIEVLLNGPKADGQLLNSEQTASLRVELAELIKRREAVLASNTDQLLAMDKERLEAERYFLVKLRSKAVKEEWKSLTRIARIESTIAKHSSRTQQERAAEVVNQFIDAVVDMDINAAKGLSTSSLRSQLGLARVRNMRRNTPAELESGFELRQAGKNRLEVWAGGKIASLLADGETWLIEDAWN
jgi:hypothetical protein